MKTYKEFLAEAKKPLTPEQEALGALYKATGGNQGLFSKAAKKDPVLKKNNAIKEEPLDFYQDAKRYSKQMLSEARVGSESIEGDYSSARDGKLLKVKSFGAEQDDMNDLHSNGYKFYSSKHQRIRKARNEKDIVYVSIGKNSDRDAKDDLEDFDIKI